MNPFRLDNQRAVVTGGGSGLGLGIAKVFVEAGAEVIIIGRNEEKLREAQLFGLSMSLISARYLSWSRKSEQ